MNYLKTITLLFLLSFSVSVLAQKEIKEGIVTMKITMSSENEQVNASLASLGNMQTTTYFNDKKSRTEMNSPMTGSSITIVDADKKDILMLMDNPMMGKKYKKSTYDPADAEKENITITETGDSKNILGYQCKGYTVLINKDGNETKMTMYVTDKISAPTQQGLKLSHKIKGYPMYMSVDMKQGDMPISTTMEVVEVKPEKIDSSKFEMKIPEGYTEIPDAN